jgi:hypothetical protein
LRWTPDKETDVTTAQEPISVLETHEYPQAVPVTTDQIINEGDLVFWDGTHFTATPLTLATQVASGGANGSLGFMGVALGSAPAQIYGGDPAEPSIPVLAKGLRVPQQHRGETYNHFDAVTIGADAQTVTKSGATSANRVGFVIIDPPSVARALQATPTPETIVGAAGVRCASSSSRSTRSRSRI